MALIGTIRERTRLLVIIVSLGLLFFIARELVGLNPLAFNKSPVIGVVAGEKITLATFQNQLTKLQRNFYLDYQETASEEKDAILRNQLWHNLVHDIIYDKICKNLDLVVSEDELVDMVQGEHIHPDIQASFIDPKTKEFDKKALTNYLRSLSQSPREYQFYWYNLEKSLAKARCQDKFDELFKRSGFLTTLEAQHSFTTDSSHVDLHYLYIPYSSIKDEEVTVTETMLKEYIQKHKNDYQVKESKEICYVSFPIIPSKTDREELHKELNALKKTFATTQEDTLFASIHTDSNPALVSLKCTEKDLPAPLMERKNDLRQGMIIGPISEGSDTYKLYKVSKVIVENPKKYEITVLEKTITPSDETREQIFRKVDDFVIKVSNKAQFEARANEDKLRVYHAKIDKNDTQVGALTNARELVRWVYNQAEQGKVSSIFELPGNYVVAMLIAHTKPGTAQLDTVREKVKQEVINAEKTKIITNKLESLIHLKLEDISAQYGTEAKIFNVPGVKFNSNRLEGVGLAHKAIGQAFALEVGQKSKIIAEQSGVVLLEVTKRQVPTAPKDWSTIQDKQLQLKEKELYRSYRVFEALKKLANTQDYRYKYY